MLVDIVTDCFRRVLRCEAVGPEENFFDLGGDSLMALSLLAEIERATHQELPLTTIYDTATINGIVAVLEQRTVPRFNPIVPIRPGDDTLPVFLVHSIFGNVVELMGLGRQMAGVRAVHGIAARGLDGLEAPNERVEAMADCYVAAITAMQPRGPYILVGYSFGGLVALEIARRLRTRGKEIAFLGFIDSYPLAATWPWRCRVAVAGQQARNNALLLLRKLRTNRAEAVRTAWQRLSGRQRVGVRAAAALDAVGDVPLPEAVRRVREAGYLALRHYRPHPYDGPVTFLSATVPVDYPRDPTAVWRRFVTELRICKIPGDHVSMLRAHTADLAAVLSQEIETAVKDHDPVRRE
jgi:acetoacetyl-CoA synthetase